MWPVSTLEHPDKESKSYFEGYWELQQGVGQQQPCTKMPLEVLMVECGRRGW